MLNNRSTGLGSALLVAFSWFALAAQAQPASDAPAASPPALMTGWWDINSRPEMVGGGPMMVLPRSTRVCITAEHLAAGQVPLPSMPTCEVVPGGAWDGARLALKVQCRGLPAEAQASGEVQGAGASFGGKIEIVLQPSKEGADRGHFVYHHIGRRVAPQCPAPAPAPAPAASGTSPAR